MTTSFSSLPIVDLRVLGEPNPSPAHLTELSERLYDAFATTGFAYLVNAPTTFSHQDVFQLAKDFFRMPEEQKLFLAKKTFVPYNNNTYRGYFPCQPGKEDNLKEGFECGPARTPGVASSKPAHGFDFAEPNVWPEETSFPGGRTRLETLHTELQTLSATLLSLLAVALGKPADYFAAYLFDSLSTLRLLHYPPQPYESSDIAEPKLCCTPHTDSGILTLLHQDQTGGLEVLNAENEWIPAPYVPGSIVVNVGDLMAKVSGGRLLATMHRVRSSRGVSSSNDGMGRFSVPFFFEPGQNCLVQSIDGHDGVIYLDWVLKKMGTWVEYQDPQNIATA